MSCPKLVKLVKTYTYGEIPLEVNLHLYLDSVKHRAL